MKTTPIVFILLATLSSLFAGDAAKGKQLYMTCLACHGPNGEGNSALKSPPLAGQEDWYLTSQLKKFKEGVRGADPKDVTGMQMRPMAMTLADDKAIADVVAHIKSFAPSTIAPTLKGDATAGKALYATCAACHGADGKGNPALKAPSLKTLPDWYIVAQLMKFKEGIRGTHPKDIEGMQMRPMSMMLADEKAMINVAAYILSL